jgi:hypothetical protein
MCGLCGLWGETAHWTSVASRPDAKRGAARLTPRLRALQQASIEREVRPLGLSVRDWSASSWIVSNASGASEIVGSLPEVWRACEALSGRRLDPLSPPMAEADPPAGRSA